MFVLHAGVGGFRHLLHVSITTIACVWAACLFGGCAVSPKAQRLNATAGDLMTQFGGGRVSLHILPGPSPAAYAWPDGRIFVSSGLMDLLDDRQLVAAVAHELGHLLADGHLRSVASISGRAGNGDPDEERRADAVGVELLRASGHDPDSMRRMLVTLRASRGVPDEYRSALGRRIDCLTCVPPAPPIAAVR